MKAVLGEYEIDRLVQKYWKRLDTFQPGQAQWLSFEMEPKIWDVFFIFINSTFICLNMLVRANLFVFTEENCIFDRMYKVWELDLFTLNSLRDICTCPYGLQIRTYLLNNQLYSMTEFYTWFTRSKFRTSNYTHFDFMFK